MRALISLILLATLTATAQLSKVGDLMSVKGTVFDAEGAVIPKVQVTVQNLDTHQTSSVSTDEIGAYAFKNLSEGKYRVTFKHYGFNTHVTELKVRKNESWSLNIILTTGIVDYISVK